MLDRDFEKRMDQHARKTVWSKVHDSDRRVDYFELPVRIGSLNLWVTAEEDRWHVETGDGAVVLTGRADGYSESCQHALRAVLGAVSSTREALIHLIGDSKD